MSTYLQGTIGSARPPRHPADTALERATVPRVACAEIALAHALSVESGPV